MITAEVVAAVEHVESRGQWWARSGCHRGVMQVCTRWARVPPAMLWLPEVNRAEGLRLLRYWHRRSGGNLRLTLAAYRCGWAGLRGECGVAYARTVLARLDRHP